MYIVPFFYQVWYTYSGVSMVDVMFWQRAVTCHVFKEICVTHVLLQVWWLCRGRGVSDPGCLPSTGGAEREASWAVWDTDHCSSQSSEEDCVAVTNYVVQYSKTRRLSIKVGCLGGQINIEWWTGFEPSQSSRVSSTSMHSICTLHTF